MNKNLIYKRINVDLICYLFFILGINICVVSAGRLASAPVLLQKIGLSLKSQSPSKTNIQVSNIYSSLSQLTQRKKKKKQLSRRICCLVTGS